ncbi:MAG: hypothetical protein JJE09_03530 [Bacteroidia bacterium]|nr:hypothetical protein [Bacteroidia bacterium]
MNIKSLILNFIDQLFDKEYKQAKISTRIILRITNTDPFSKMAIQDKVTSLATLMLGFQKDFGFIPENLCRRLVHLNQKLTLETNEDSLGRK